MLLEYIAGGELFSRLRKEGRFSIDVALFYSSEILLALQFVHKNDVVYRDLKPENLLIDHTGHIKLADFGLAEFLPEGKPCLTSAVGTPGYICKSLNFQEVPKLIPL